MGILDTAKQIRDQLTGEAQRQREREEQRKADLAKESETQRKAADLTKEAAADKARERAAAEKSREERKHGGPADRLAAQVLPGQEDRMREARDRKPEPEKAPEVKPQEAERMKYQPTGLQRGPSPGGGLYVNTLAHRQQDLKEAPKREPTMIEKMQERQKDQPSQAQKQALERQQNQGIER